MGRASVCVGGDESVAAPAAAVPDPVPDRPTRATRKTQASSIDTLYGVEDIRELRSLILLLRFDRLRRQIDQRLVSLC